MANSTDDIRVSSKGLDEAIPIGRRMENEVRRTLAKGLISKYTIAEVQKTSLREQLHHRKRENEAEIIRKALEKNRFNKGKAARILGISRTTLWKKLKGFDIQ